MKTWSGGSCSAAPQLLFEPSRIVMMHCHFNHAYPDFCHCNFGWRTTIGTLSYFA
jgi:hypothetical protein